MDEKVQRLVLCRSSIVSIGGTKTVLEQSRASAYPPPVRPFQPEGLYERIHDAVRSNEPTGWYAKVEETPEEAYE